MSEFEKRLQSLNDNQLEAVRKLDGPLLVLAGPGTGKTTLLIMRIAYILKNTDTLPESILCLTFTDSAQKTMQTRLVDLLGQDAYKVQVHTFHSFGGWATRHYPQYFENLIGSQLADDVTRYKLFLSIFEKLDHHDPLAVTNDGDYIYLSDAMTRISQLKQAAVSPQALEKSCASDKEWLDLVAKKVEQDLAALKTVSKSSVLLFENLLHSLETLTDKSELGRICYLELRDALDESAATERVSTKPLTAWKNSWLNKKADGNFELKYAGQLKKLHSLAKVYDSYQKAIRKQSLTDYDDQLMYLLDGMRSQPDLLAELQERFLYLMADEYQDTNGVQQKLLETLADNVSSAGRPNLMVVGDDDQAIYGFQGAYSSNVLDFLKRWRDVETVTLTVNYRSTPEIVKFSRSIITQGEARLENHYEYINKELTTPNKPGIAVRLLLTDSQLEEYPALVQNIQQDLKSGIEPEEIVVLAPQHKYLERLVPYLAHHNIGVSYERRQDSLNEEHIRQIIHLSEIVTSLAANNLQEVNAKLPELLSFPWLKLESETLWEVSLQAYKQKKLWLEVMLESDEPKVSAIAQWLLKQANASLNTPLEHMLDILTGHSNDSRNITEFVSPYYTHYFLERESIQDLQYYLSSLLVIRRHIRNFVGAGDLKLLDFVNYCKLRVQTHQPIVNDHALTSNNNAVSLMTAYKAKGMEFQSVYLLDSRHSVWAKPRGRSSLIVMPQHIAAVPSGESTDEYLRLFYVAITRAADKLTLVTAHHDDSNVPILPIGWLQDSLAKESIHEQPLKNLATESVAQGLTFDWHSAVAAFTDADWRTRLSDRLLNYRLSPTALSAFLDVTNGGPRTFLINQLLRFPTGINANIAFGNAMHSTMQYLHNEVQAHGTIPSKNDAVQFFADCISQYTIGDIELSKQIGRGEYAVNSLLTNARNLFSDKGLISEVDMKSEDIIIGEAKVTGKVDLIDIASGTIKDYKTGKPVGDWPKSGSKTYDALKIHRYRQQLVFYKLMTDQAQSCSEYNLTSAQLVFLESADHNKLQVLSFDYEQAEIERLERLIQVVWERIMSLDLPDVTNYAPDVTGIRNFEEDLLNSN